MADKTLASLTAATPATGGLIYGTQGGADRKFTLSAVGAALIEAATAADQRTALSAGYSLTGSDAASLFDLSGAWNTSGTPTALKLNITDTASNAASLFLDFQVGGISNFSVRKDGAIRCGDGTYPLSINGKYGTTNFTQFGDGGLLLNASFSTTSNLTTYGTNGKVFLGTPTGYVSFNDDLLLKRSAAAVLQLGGNDATTPTAQTIKAHDVTTGTGASLEIAGGTGSVARGNVTLNGGNRAAYDASPSATTIRDILISHGLMAAS